MFTNKPRSPLPSLRDKVAKLPVDGRLPMLTAQPTRPRLGGLPGEEDQSLRAYQREQAGLFNHK